MTIKIQSLQGQEVLSALITLAMNNDRKLNVLIAKKQIPNMISFDADPEDIDRVLNAYTSESSICDPQDGKIMCIFRTSGKEEVRLTASDETCDALRQPLQSRNESKNRVSPNSIPDQEIYTQKEVQDESSIFNAGSSLRDSYPNTRSADGHGFIPEDIHESSSVSNDDFCTQDQYNDPRFNQIADSESSGFVNRTKGSCSYDAWTGQYSCEPEDHPDDSKSAFDLSGYDSANSFSSDSDQFSQRAEEAKSEDTKPEYMNRINSENPAWMNDSDFKQDGQKPSEVLKESLVGETSFELTPEDQMTLIEEESMSTKQPESLGKTSESNLMDMFDQDQMNPQDPMEEEYLMESSIEQIPGPDFAAEETQAENRSSSDRLIDESGQITSRATGDWFGSEIKDPETALESAALKSEKIYGMDARMANQDLNDLDGFDGIDQMDDEEDQTIRNMAYAAFAEDFDTEQSYIKGMEDAQKNQVSPIEEADPLQLLESNISIDQDVKDHNEINRKDEARDEEDQISNDQHLSQFESERESIALALEREEGEFDERQMALDDYNDYSQTIENSEPGLNQTSSAAKEINYALGTDERSVQEQMDAKEKMLQDSRSPDKFFDEEEDFSQVQMNSDDLNESENFVSEGLKLRNDNSFIDPDQGSMVKSSDGKIDESFENESLLTDSWDREDPDLLVMGLQKNRQTAYRCTPEQNPELYMDNMEVVDLISEDENANAKLRRKNVKLSRKIDKANDRITQQERKIEDHNNQIQRNQASSMKSMHESQIRHNKKVIDRKVRKIAKIQDKIDDNNRQLR